MRRTRAMMVVMVDTGMEVLQREISGVNSGLGGICVRLKTSPTINQCSQLIDSIDLEAFMIAIRLHLRAMDRDPWNQGNQTRLPNLA